jgi:histidyl-tRNA synthetase
LTVPLARVVAEHGERLPRFFKRYQIQPVWRADRPARGRFREFYQCDVDCIGTRSMVVEAELCGAVSDVLLKLGFNDFIIRLNHRQVLAGMLEVAGITSNRQNDALVIIDKLDKIGPEGIEKELAEKGFNGPKIPALLEFLSFSREDANHQQYGISVLHRMANFLNDANSERQEGHYELAQIEQLTGSNSASQYIRFDASLARGLSYYTGAIMEISVPDLAGSLGGGGRYDNLVGMFSGRDIPACGFSLGLERIIVVMSERGMFPADLERAAADVLVTVWNEESIKDSLAFAGELRRSAPGLRVDVYPEADKLGKQLKYASSRGVPFVVVIGEEERARGEVALKHMVSSKQQSVSREQAASILYESLYGHKDRFLSTLLQASSAEGGESQTKD